MPQLSKSEYNQVKILQEVFRNALPLLEGVVEKQESLTTPKRAKRRKTKREKMAEIQAKILTSRKPKKSVMNKLDFAASLTELGSYGVAGTSDCFKYGSTWGCNIDCPVFQGGGCECEDSEAFYRMLINSDCSEEEFSKYLELYPSLSEYSNL